MFNPTPLNLPFYPFKITQRDGLYYIFDEARKKHLVLTPEEWVRQHFIKYLISEKQFPPTLMQIEGGLSLNQTKKRSDILVYTQSGEKLMVIECKAPSVNITQATFDQAARYNAVYKAKWLAITNGLNHYYAEIDHHNKAFKLVEELPTYSQL
ncbi:type I restriction enzyme HsdR N-terminal domain-containing protein [Pedobacter sp. SL55]|uniref:type I restriction enzyme HsdR N-terminal domain-containing protein n=1 Tax=Pedobacter sp. SL55 TaxID=2995161 RepID=UPI00227142F7|nr:type I restriction enzyme HsdR N-terminal domain-containing protein [Pedobacter sp. SL55]WAC39327.1 type I restriction enzyme HsdR N-terminal domain-containing protein [Pedobacter sp. SL55]